jgi:hypothetical protein
MNVITEMTDVHRAARGTMYRLRLSARVIRFLRFGSKARHRMTNMSRRHVGTLPPNVIRFPSATTAVSMGCPHCGADASYILRSRLRWYDYAVLCIVRGLRCGSCWRRFYALRSWLRKSLDPFVAPTELRPVSKIATQNARSVSLTTTDFKAKTDDRRNEKATA